MRFFLQKSTDLKEAGVFHLCITFSITSASVKSGIHLSPVSDRVDKTPNGWLTEWVHSGERHWLHLLTASFREYTVYQNVKASLSGYCVHVWLYMWLFHITLCQGCASHVIFMCAHVTLHIFLHCSLYANGYWQHDVMCICLSVYPCVFLKRIYGTSEGQC